jgi:hypothetical protein
MVRLREHLEQRLGVMDARMDNIDQHLDAVAGSQSDYLRRDTYDAQHEALRSALDALRALHAADVAELRMAQSGLRSRMGGATAALVIAVTVLTGLLAAITFLRG